MKTCKERYLRFVKQPPRPPKGSRLYHGFPDSICKYFIFSNLSIQCGLVVFIYEQPYKTKDYAILEKKLPQPGCGLLPPDHRAGQTCRNGNHCQRSGGNFHSKQDVQAVLGDIVGVMHIRMSQGKSIHIKGLGYFRYALDTKGVKDPKEFNFAKQVQAVRVQFIPERTKQSNGSFTRALLDSDQLEWIELSPETKDQDPAQGRGDGGDIEKPWE